MLDVVEREKREERGERKERVGREEAFRKKEVLVVCMSG
jgi:hypothetical protein